MLYFFFGSHSRFTVLVSTHFTKVMGLWAIFCYSNRGFARRAMFCSRAQRLPERRYVVPYGSYYRTRAGRTVLPATVPGYPGRENCSTAAILYSCTTVQYSSATARTVALQYSTVLDILYSYSTEQYSCYCTVLYSTVLYCTVR